MSLISLYLSLFLSFSLLLALPSFSSFLSSSQNSTPTSMRRMRRYLCDFSKGGANLNCRLRAIPTVVHFPWNICLLSSALSSSYFLRSTVFFHVAVLRTYIYLPVMNVLPSLEKRNVVDADEHRFTEEDCDLWRLWTWKERRGDGVRLKKNLNDRIYRLISVKWLRIKLQARMTRRGCAVHVLLSHFRTI